MLLLDDPKRNSANTAFLSSVSEEDELPPKMFPNIPNRDVGVDVVDECGEFDENGENAQAA